MDSKLLLHSYLTRLDYIEIEACLSIFLVCLEHDNSCLWALLGGLNTLCICYFFIRFSVDYHVCNCR